MKLAFVDVETVALADGHPALWECAIILRDEGQADTEYLWQLRPALDHAEAGALRVGAYYRRSLIADRPTGSAMTLAHPRLAKGKRQALPVARVAYEMAVLLDDALLVGANPWFDAGHIDVFLREHGQALAADYHMRDIGSVVVGFIAGRCHGAPAGSEPLRPADGSRKLTDMARAVGLDPGQYKTHTALGDCRLTRDIWNAVFA